ncbi:MAG: 2-oxo acid dehydrogenase subunit E2 [Spirochaetales bacterium]|nr:2-oxo acid dehydrogenase subunit E2 [Spirochaetales bacterium]
MAFKKRKDGIYLKNLPAFRRIFPYLMKTRTESIIYFTQKIDMTTTLEYLGKINDGRSREERFTLFHVFLAAISRTMKLRPQLNRFIAGQRIYEHKDTRLTFIVKKELTEEAEETNAQIIFSGTETLAEIKEKVAHHLSDARSEKKGDDDRFIDFIAVLPRPIINIIAWLIRWLDYHNILPQILQKAIPLYTSVYMANLGSIGLDAPYHHLFEYGSASIFLVIGKMHKEALVDEYNQIRARDCINVSFTLDERITEGFYCARSILLFTQLIKYPELLDAGELQTEKILEYSST